jgi:hypothetical protein
MYFTWAAYFRSSSGPWGPLWTCESRVASRAASAAASCSKRCRCRSLKEQKSGDGQSGHRVVLFLEHTGQKWNLRGRASGRSPYLEYHGAHFCGLSLEGGLAQGGGSRGCHLGWGQGHGHASRTREQPCRP